MRLFGDILPFIGFRVIDRRELNRRGGMPAGFPDSPLGFWELFELEWLGHGLTLTVRPIIEIIG